MSNQSSNQQLNRLPKTSPRGSPKVVIVGAGFAGVAAAKALARSGVKVILIDRNNYHTFIPMLYQVATAVIDPQQVGYPVRRLFRHLPAVQFLHTAVERVDFNNRLVYTLEGMAVDYDYLVLATGSRSNDLGVPGTPEHTLPLGSLTEATAIRNHVLSCCEQAVKTPDADQRQALLTFAIVGGGPTGVELAGALHELMQTAIRRDYPTLNWADVKIFLLQAGGQLLKSYPPKLGVYTAKWLRRQGVEVCLNAQVTQVTEDAVYFQQGSGRQESRPERLPTHTVIWTAGLLAAAPESQPPLETASRNKIEVAETLQVVSYPDVYAIGDLAQVDRVGESLTGVAQEAIQQGQAAAHNILRQMRGQPLQPFSYHDKGRLAMIGRHAGVGQVNGRALQGFLPWFLWLAVHLWYLPGLRNRLAVLFNWLKCYFLGEGTTRLILSPPSPNRSIQTASKAAKSRSLI